jgi:hypothetical protein
MRTSMLPPLSLNDSELSALMDAAAPLAPDVRDLFVKQVASELASRRADEVGPGLIYRTLRDVQRRFWQPPDLARGNETSKYR